MYFWKPHWKFLIIGSVNQASENRENNFTCKKSAATVSYNKCKVMILLLPSLKLFPLIQALLLCCQSWTIQ